MPIQVRTRIALFLAAVAALTACGETTVNAPLAAGSVAATNAIILTGPVGSTLPDPVRVTVRSTDNQPLAGATVTFSVTNGGVADPSSTISDANGVAITKWILGRTVGANVLTATSGSVSTSFTAVASATKAAAVSGVTGDNQGSLDRQHLERIRPDAIFLLLSRAGLVDFDAFVDLVAEGRFRAATDVFPIEPAPADLRARSVDGLLLSAHRAGGLPEVLAEIGEMVVDDLTLIRAGLPPQRLQAARPETVGRWRNPPGRSYAPGTRR